MRPVNKGKSPYTEIKKYQDAAPYLEEVLGSYCSYCGMPISHVPEVEHKISKSKCPELTTKWENLLLGCKYCNSRKKDVIDSDNVGNYLWPDQDNTVLAYSYVSGVPRINENMISQLDPSGETLTKAKKLFELINLCPDPSLKPDKRVLCRNKVYQIASRSKEQWDGNRSEDMKELIVKLALAEGFFSIWTTVFGNEPEILTALIDAFPGTEKYFFDPDGRVKLVLTKPDPEITDETDVEVYAASV